MVSTRESISLRPAAAYDCDDIYAWRNHSLTRKMSLNQSPVAYEQHQKWFNTSLTNPDRFMWLGLETSKKIGICRFDFDSISNDALVSIQLNPEYFNRGYGTPFLKEAMQRQLMITSDCRFIAVVRRENERSHALFNKLEYSLVEQTKDNLIYAK